MYDDEAMADPHPNVLNLTSEMTPSSPTRICSFITLLVSTTKKMNQVKDALSASGCADETCTDILVELVHVPHLPSVFVLVFGPDIGFGCDDRAIPSRESSGLFAHPSEAPTHNGRVPQRSRMCGGVEKNTHIARVLIVVNDLFVVSPLLTLGEDRPNRCSGYNGPGERCRGEGGGGADGLAHHLADFTVVFGYLKVTDVEVEKTSEKSMGQRSQWWCRPSKVAISSG